MRPLAPGYSSEIDAVDEQAWNRLVLEFADGNIYQTWSYGAVIGGSRNLRHLVLKLNGEVVAIAQARIKRLPVVGLGIAYVQWGPLWRRTNVGPNAEIFRQALRALHNDFVCRHGLTVRLFPLVFEDDVVDFRAILAEEGFAAVAEEAHGRTILMNLAPNLADLRENMSSHWKRELKVAEKSNLEFTENSSQESFESFIEMYKEMVSRKKFVEPNDIHQFERIQQQLPEQLRMRVLLCKSNSGLSAGAIYSLVGNSAIYLFGATSNAGMKSRGSYFLQWKIVEALKQKNVAFYNLNGINPEKNPGTYKFKSDLAGKHGRDVFYAGRFEAHAGSLTRSLVQIGDALRKSRRSLQQRILDWRTVKPQAEVKVASTVKTAPVKTEASQIVHARSHREA